MSALVVTHYSLFHHSDLAISKGIWDFKIFFSKRSLIVSDPVMKIMKIQTSQQLLGITERCEIIESLVDPVTLMATVVNALI